MYTGYLLSDDSRELLASIFPPKNPTWLGHHITEVFGVQANHPAPEEPEIVQVIGYAEQDGIEGFLVSIDGNTQRPKGGLYHITWSIDKSKGRKPFHTNKIIGDAERISPINISVTPKTFTQSTEAEMRQPVQESFLAFLRK